MLDRAQIDIDIKKRCDETGVYIPSQTRDSINVAVDVIVEHVNRELAASAKKPEPKAEPKQLTPEVAAALSQANAGQADAERIIGDAARPATQQPRSNQNSNQGRNRG
jgi:hypothetical protein